MSSRSTPARTFESRTIIAVGTAGVEGTGIDLDTPLTLSHLAGATVTDTRVLQSTAVLGTDYTVVQQHGRYPGGQPVGHGRDDPDRDAPQPQSVGGPDDQHHRWLARMAASGVTVNNNDPSTVVINAHGFPYLDSSLSVAERVNDLMSRMSLFDKVAQMTQTNMTVLTNGTTTNESVLQRRPRLAARLDPLRRHR